MIHDFIRNNANTDSKAQTQTTADKDRDGKSEKEVKEKERKFAHDVGTRAQRGFVPVHVMFSAQTSSQNLQYVLETKLHFIRKNLLGMSMSSCVFCRALYGDTHARTPAHTRRRTCWQEDVGVC